MDIKETNRLHNLLCYEDELFLNGFDLIAGVDEVGRGSLAGPIVAAAVILKRDDIFIEDLNDSKKLHAEKRRQVFKKIMKSALCYSVAKISNRKIDEISLGKANIKVMEMAVSRLSIPPQIVLSDSFSIPCRCSVVPIVKGDMLSASIAAASVIAKVIRDDIMIKFSKIYNGYDLENNKGYGTYKHMRAIRELGPTSIHRRSFHGVMVEEIF